MIENFDQIRTQLKDLAEVLNSYKSEAVQLRLVEIIFGAAPRVPAPPGLSATGEPPAAPVGARVAAGKRRWKKRPSAASDEDGTSKPRNGGSRNGPRSTLATLVDEGFFKTPRTLGQLVEHCDHHLARKFKSSDFSGAMARYTREKRLKRVKNADGQYEYTQST